VASQVTNLQDFDFDLSKIRPMSTGILLALAVAASSGTPDADLEKSLRAKDQALVDAYAPGNRATWEAALAPDALYLNENNVTMTRSAFLDQLQPLPPNTSGRIEIVDYRMVRSGDVATVIHKDAETEIYHGQTLRSTFMMSETWKETPAGWRLLLLHTDYVLKEPPAIQLPPQELTAYPGKYRAGPDLVYVVTLSGGSLTGAREGRPGVPLLAEVKDVFFIAGQPRTRKIFQRDGHGAVTGFVDRREGTDIVWTKIGDQ
jgi:hypothetical protein